MKFAIISDIHANLEALNSALHYIRQEEINHIMCLGDVVGYGPFPNECTDIIRKTCEVCLIGNHDSAAVDLTDIFYFNQYARDAILWTREKLTEYNKEYLKKLPFSHEVESILFVHSTPVKPEEWNYVHSEYEARQYMNRIGSRVTFIGHSHIPVIFSYNEGAFYKEKLNLNPDDRYIINVGSVGQPRDGDPRLCFVVFDSETNDLQYIRIQYDVQKTYQAILDHELPPFLAMRLLSGQ